MDNYSLVSLLDEDREMVMANLARDRALPAAQAVLEKAVDRVMYRYVEGCDVPQVRDGAQVILQAMKNTLPLMDAVGEARTWQKQVETGRRKGLQMRPMTMALIAVGAVLTLAAVLGALITSRAAGPLSFITALVPVLLGGGCLFWAGAKSAKPPKQKDKAPEAASRTEYLVDAEKAWHCLRGAMLQADGQLERLREEAGAREREHAAAEPAGGLSAGELDLFAELLESAYDAADERGREATSAIRFFLHNAGIDTVDYEAGREAWFEFLPAQKPGTIRPALTSEGRLLKKGMASAKR